MLRLACNDVYLGSFIELPDKFRITVGQQEIGSRFINATAKIRQSFMFGFTEIGAVIRTVIGIIRRIQVIECLGLYLGLAEVVRINLATLQHLGTIQQIIFV